MSLSFLLIGLVCGMVTGLLSIGGGIILISFLIIIPPLLMDRVFSMATIGGYAMLQAFFSTLSGSFYYWKSKLINWPIILFMGIPSALGAFIGSYLANFVPDLALRILFIILAVGAAAILQIPQKRTEEGEMFQFRLWSVLLTAAAGLAIGGIGGLIGLAAGFIYVPALTYFYRLGIKKAIGSSLVICFLLACGGLLAKFSSQAIEILLGLSLVIGGVIGAQIGSRLGKFLADHLLRHMATGLILLICLRLIYDLIS